MSEYTELKRLAEAATQCSGPRRVETDYNGVHQVLGDGSWKILNAWHTPDGKGRFNAEFHAAASPLVVLALISTIDVLRNDTESRCEWINEASAEIDRLQAIEAERDQLKAENEALSKDAERYQWLRDISESIHHFYLSTPIWFTGVKFSKENVDSTIDAAMGKGDQS